MLTALEHVHIASSATDQVRVKTAKVIWIDIALALLSRAYEVIE
jgi:hypothetical protein